MASIDVPFRLGSDEQQPAREVIDVDSLDDDNVLVLNASLPSLRGTGSTSHVTGTRRPSGSSSASAILVESDDEVEVTRVNNAHVQRRFLSPPPRPVHPRYVPPVPPIPRHLAGQGAFPIHLGRREGAPPPPAIQPQDRPFPFEAHIRQPVPRGHTPPVDVPPPAPVARSHHQPAMGLGGALIALNRQHVAEEANRRREAQEQLQRQQAEQGWRRYLPAFMNDWWRHDESEPALRRRVPIQTEIYPGRILFNGPIDDLEDLEILRDIMDNQFGGGGLRGPLAAAERPREQHYKPSYTHPDKPMPSFTFDFAPPELPSKSGASPPIIVLDDDDETTAGQSKTSGKSSAVEATATLVCACCNDPLVLSAESVAPADQLARVKIWGLRCGHILDGKCIQGLMKPPAPMPLSTAPSLDAEEVVDDPKGKGKARAVLHADIVMDIAEPDPPPSGRGKRRATAKDPNVPRRGKRKATEMLQSEAGPSAVGASRADNVDVPPEDNSIRSRLRPRHPRQPSHVVTPPAHETTAETVAVSPPSPARPVRALPRRRGNGTSSAIRVRGKGKGKAKSVFEATHDWVCPVAGCAHAHTSIRVDGEWKTHPEKGAISLFI